MRGRFALLLIVIFIFAVMTVLFLIPLSVSAQNVTNQNTGQEYSTIQEAIDDASPDDRIEISAGTFNERIVINKSVDLSGAGPGTTIIDGGGNGTCIVATGWVFWTLENLTVTNGTDGMMLDGTSGYVRNCRFHDFSDDGSSAVVLERSWLNISNCMIDDNYRGIFARNDSYLQCSDSTIQYNRGTWPGDTETGNGIYVENSMAVIWRCNISFNRPHALLIRFDSTVYIAENSMYGNHEDAINFENCTWGTGSVVNNTIQDSGNLGILVEYDSWDIDLTIEGNHISNSGTSTGWGSGIGLQDCSGITILNNTVTGSREAGIDVWSANSLVIEGNEMSGNQHGIWCRDSSLVDVIDCMVQNNMEHGILIEDSMYIHVNRSVIRENPTGIATGSSLVVKVHECNIIGNPECGLNALPSSIGNVNATGNWWGSTDGPGGDGPGSGDNVTGNVTYHPWLTSRYVKRSNQPPTATIDSIYVPPPGKGDQVFFSGHGNDPDGEVVAYKWRSNVTGTLSRNASFNVTNLTVGKHTIYFSVMDDNDTWSSEAVEVISLEEPCDDCGDEEDKDETSVPESSIAVVVTFVIVIVTMTIWFNLSRKSKG